MRSGPTNTLVPMAFVRLFKRREERRTFIGFDADLPVVGEYPAGKEFVVVRVERTPEPAGVDEGITERFVFLRC